MRKFAHAHLLSAALAKGLVYTFQARLVPRVFFTLQTGAILKIVEGKDLGTSLLFTPIRGSLFNVSSISKHANSVFS